MLSLHPQDLPHYHHVSTYRSLSPHPTEAQMPYLTGFSIGGGEQDNFKQMHSSQHSASHQHQQQQPHTQQDTTVAQALEIARESADGARDPTIVSILNNALDQVWSKVQAQPNSYVMTRDEFAVFNYFQHRFTGNDVAKEARRRYWDNTTA